MKKGMGSIKVRAGMIKILGIRMPEKIRIPNESKSIEGTCEICGTAKPLMRAHIFPKRFLLKYKGLDHSLLDYRGRNVIVLCANHHILFDRFNLDIEDFAIIWPKVASITTEILEKYPEVPESIEPAVSKFLRSYEAYV